MVREKNINQLPKDWNWARLGDVAIYSNGRAFKPSEWQEEGRPIIRIQNLNNEASKYNYSNEEFEERYKVLKGDLLFAWSASLGAYIWKGEEAWLNQHIFKVIPKDNTDKKYLYFILEWTVHELYAKAHGSGMVHVTKGKFEATLIPLPPKNTQEAIVAKIEELFSELDNGIAQLKTVKQQLEIYRQTVLKYAFEGKLTNKNVKDGVLPDGWKCVKLGNVIEKPKYGTSKKCEYEKNGIGVLRIPNVVKGVVDSSDLKFAQFDKQEIETYSLREGDVLIIRSNGSIDIVGKSALITKKDERFLYAGYLIRLRPIQTSILPEYLLNILSSIDLRHQIEAKAKSTSGVNNINSEELAALKISLPLIEEQHAIIQEIESRLSISDKMEETISQSLQQAKTLRQSILKMAFEGRLVAADTIEAINNTTKLQANKVSEITL